MITIPFATYNPLNELPIPVRSLSSTVEVLIPTGVLVEIPAVSEINLPADTPVRNRPSPRILVALTIPAMMIVPIPLYSPKLALSFGAVIVPSAGVPILTAEPNAMMNICASDVGGFENVIWSLTTVYYVIASCMTPPNDTNKVLAEPGLYDCPPDVSVKVVFDPSNCDCRSSSLT